jgi:X-X-X-Leu-X-X-Gly heptad repeat protein
MQTARKIVSVIVMILSVLLLVVMLAGIVGVWAVRGPAIDLVTEVSTFADNAASRALNIVSTVDNRVARTQGAIDTTVAVVTAGGETIKQTSLALVALEKLLDTDLSPTVTRITDGVNDVRDTIRLLDRTISTLQFFNRNRETPALDTADRILEQVKAVDQQVQGISQSVKDTKANAVDTAVTKITSPLSRASDGLGEASAGLNELQTGITNRQAQLHVLTQQVISGITVAAVILTLALLWMAFAQVALFVHAYGSFTGRDPLARWHNAKPEIEPVPQPQPTA